MIVWIELVLTLLLAASQPLLGTVLSFSTNTASGMSPATLLLASGIVLIASFGSLSALPQLRRLPRCVWSGWSLSVQKERTPSLPDLSEPWLGIVHAPLFNPKTIYAGRMLSRGMDSTVALSSCLVVLLASSAQIISCISGDSPARLLPSAICLFVSLLLWAFSILTSVRAIGHPSKYNNFAAKSKRHCLWAFTLPMLVLLYAFCCALLPVLSLRLDQTPVSGWTAILYALMRSLFLTLVMYLLFHAPAKLAMLAAPQKPHLTPWLFYTISGIAYFVWLTIDFFHPIF